MMEKTSMEEISRFVGGFCSEETKRLLYDTQSRMQDISDGAAKIYPPIKIADDWVDFHDAIQKMIVDDFLSARKCYEICIAGRVIGWNMMDVMDNWKSASQKKCDKLETDVKDVTKAFDIWHNIALLADKVSEGALSKEWVSQMTDVPEQIYSRWREHVRDSIEKERLMLEEVMAQPAARSPKQGDRI